MNQCIDLVQEQVDTLWQLAQLGCEWKMKGLCVTSVPYNNMSHAANLSRHLSQYLTGNWSGSFDDLMQNLRMAIVTINSTRVDISMAEGLTTWIHQAMIRLKEWAGIGVLAVALVGVCALCLFCICRMARAQRRERAMVVRAFQAIEAGVSPQAWLLALKQ